MRLIIYINAHKISPLEKIFKGSQNYDFCIARDKDVSYRAPAVAISPEQIIYYLPSIN